jgi:hypothetical protein
VCSKCCVVVFHHCFLLLFFAISYCFFSPSPIVDVVSSSLTLAMTIIIHHQLLSVLIDHCLFLMLFYHLLLLLLFAIACLWCCFTISCYHHFLLFFVIVTFVCCGVSYSPSHTLVLCKYSSWNIQHLTTLIC